MSKLFISYRREDSNDSAGRLYDKLEAHFGRENVFKDVDSIPLGVDFRKVLQDAVGQCSAMLVVIGRRWVDITDDDGHRRLDSPSDFVRIEVEAALARDIPVIPVLVQGASIPLEHQLPNSLAPLAYRNAFEVRGDPHFHRDADQLIFRLTPILQTASPVPAPSHTIRRSQQAAPNSYGMLRDRFPARLQQLGFVAQESNGVEYILPALCDVPAGAFHMGANKRGGTAGGDESPQHTVTLPAYQIARYTVTVAEFTCFVHSSQRRPGIWTNQLGKLEHPIVNVSWYDAVAYAAWLAECTGQPWRLPSEAEWEKAARGTDFRFYPWGNKWDSSCANTLESDKGATTPIGSYPSDASPYGVHDVVGNVWEWTSTLYMPYPYTPDDGREALHSTKHRVLRGGSWSHTYWHARVTARYDYQPSYPNVLFGFRLCCSAVLTS